MGCCPSTEVDEETERLVNPRESDKDDPTMPKEWVDKYKTYLDAKDRNSRQYDSSSSTTSAAGYQPSRAPPPPQPPSSSAKFALDPDFKAKFQNWQPKPGHHS
jgi:hypothetical protein